MKKFWKDYVNMVWNPQIGFIKLHWVGTIVTYVIIFLVEYAGLLIHSKRYY